MSGDDDDPNVGWTSGYPPVRQLPLEISNRERTRIRLMMLTGRDPFSDAESEELGPEEDRDRRLAMREDARSIALFDE